MKEDKFQKKQIKKAKKQIKKKRFSDESIYATLAALVEDSDINEVYNMLHQVAVDYNVSHDMNHKRIETLKQILSFNDKDYFSNLTEATITNMLEWYLLDNDEVIGILDRINSDSEKLYKQMSEKIYVVRNT